MVTFTINIPQMLAYIPYMDPMGYIMWAKHGKIMPCLPPMTGNGKHTTYKNGDDWGMVYCFTHIISLSNYSIAISGTDLLELPTRYKIYVPSGKRLHNYGKIHHF